VCVWGGGDTTVDDFRKLECGFEWGGGRRRNLSVLPLAIFPVSVSLSYSAVANLRFTLKWATFCMGV